MGSPPTSTLNVTANQPGVTLTISTPGSRDNSERNLGLSASGTDAAVLNTVVNDISYVGTSSNTPDTFTFGGLGANRNLYVQVVGGDAGWDGQFLVKANSGTVGTWTTTTGGPSIYGFNSSADGGGILKLDFTIASGSFAGLGGIIISSAVPEPASFGLLGVGATGLLIRRRRTV